MLLLIIRNTKTVLTRLDKVWDRIEQSPKVVGPLLCNGDRPRALDLCLWRRRSALVVHLPIAATQSINTRNKRNTTHRFHGRKRKVYLRSSMYYAIVWWWCDYVCIFTSSASFGTFREPNLFPYKALAIGMTAGATAMRRRRRNVRVDRLELWRSELALFSRSGRAAGRSSAGLVVDSVPVLTSFVRSPATWEERKKEKNK
jgi:hypothetical protein